MVVQTADIRPGKCFLSQGAKPQVVRVLAVSDGLVRFEAGQAPVLIGTRGDGPAGVRRRPRQ